MPMEMSLERRSLIPGFRSLLFARPVSWLSELRSDFQDLD